MCPSRRDCLSTVLDSTVSGMPNDPKNIARAQSHAHDFTRTGEDWRARNRLEALGDAAAMLAGAERLVQARVDMARRHHHTWQEIGDALGISRQGAQQRYGSNDA